jgi:two-component system CheB/CheR fusion protein
VQRDQFLAVLSHELRNPLAAILNAAQVLEGQDGATVVKTWSQVIERRSRHMARLLDDLLDVARIAQNKFEVRREVVDLAACAHDAIEEVRPMFAEREVRLTIDWPNVPVTVEGDPARLQQIQVNLLQNAVKHTPKGGDVRFAIRPLAAEAEIRVSDTGVGIAPEMIGKIFDLFVQSTAANHAASGIGVGLSLVREIVSRHGGTVSASSGGPGQGSEFVVRLPLSERSPTAEGAGSSADSEFASPQCGANARPRPSILIVEDDADIRESLKTLLEIQGYPVRTAGDGPSALTAIADRPPDVALVDIGLPGYDGCELARRIRGEPANRRLRLIALTGYGQPADREATAAAGFNAHLTKPLKPADLYRCLEGE